MMARNPYYSGPIASTVLSTTGDMGSDGGFLHKFVNGGGADSALSSLFYNRKNDPDAQRADLYRAQTEAARAEMAQKQAEADAIARGRTASTDLGSAADEYVQREGGPQMLGQSASKIAPVLFGQARDAIAKGADPKAVTAQMRAFALASGDPNLMVSVNSALEAKYLGENESPTIGRQDLIREDKQEFEGGQNDADRALKKYGFNLESGDRRYNTDTDARVQMRGQDVSAGTTRRGQDMTDNRARANADKAHKDDLGTETVQVTTVDKGSTGAPAKHKLFGVFGQDVPAVAPRAPSKTVKTVKRPVGPKKLVYDPKTGGLVAK
jgi:hypothetical protein